MNAHDLFSLRSRRVRHSAWWIKLIGFGANRKKSDLLKELSAVKKNIGIGYCFVIVYKIIIIYAFITYTALECPGLYQNYLSTFSMRIRIRHLTQNQIPSFNTFLFFYTSEKINKVGSRFFNSGIYAFI